LGCFVRLDNGGNALLSNNHVVAGENRGRKGDDRILQPGSSIFDPADQIAVLSDFVAIQDSPPGNTPRKGGVNFNEIDAGVAELDSDVPFAQGYLPFRQLVAPSATAIARVGDRVFKVGRTTGLTHGEVTDVATIVGPIPYDPGPCWFRRSITIEGLNGTQFSDKGDSGSAIVRTNGQIVGILYAGNGAQTYACPIDTVLQSLQCTLF
jgi:S1-C subfamily serine protease